MGRIVDKEAIRQIIGTLMKEPTYLSHTDKYNLSINDFSSTFERYIFSAIYNLYSGGANSITEVDIDNYFNTHEVAKATFEKENGIEYLQDALEFCQLDNFDFYYRRLKKLNCLNDLKDLGYDISNIYEEDLTNPKSKDINEKFELLEVGDIFETVKRNLLLVENRYKSGDASETVDAATGMRKLIKELELTPEVGAPLQGEIFNTVCRGSRRSKFYIRSADSGTGKTRRSVGDACFLSFPIRFNSQTWQWEKRGSCEKSLIIATEQDYAEIQTLILAYLTDINEEKILYSNYNELEKVVIAQALEVVEYYKDNLFLVQISNPNIEKIKAVVRQNCILHDIKNVFYDYIFSSPSLLNEFRDLRIREDVALGMLSTALKDLAVEMNLFVMSSTQTNAKSKEERGLKDETVIRGSRAIIDKCDIACIMSRVTPEEEEAMKEVIDSIGIVPNQVCDIYKVRRGKYSKVRIWSYVDLGTCRMKDLFITDERNNQLNNFKCADFQFYSDDESNWKEMVDKLNADKGLEIDTETGEVEIKKISFDEVEELDKQEKGFFGDLL